MAPHRQRMVPLGSEGRVGRRLNEHLAERLARGSAILRLIPRPLHIVDGGRNHHAAGVLGPDRRSRQRHEVGEFTQREIDLEAAPFGSDPLNSLREATWKGLLRHQTEKRPLRIRVRQHDVAPVFAAIRQDDTDRPVISVANRGDLLAADDLSAMLPQGQSQRLGHAPHPAADQCPCPRSPSEPGCRVVELAEGGPGRPRAGGRSRQAPIGQRALHVVRFEEARQILVDAGEQRALQHVHAIRSSERVGELSDRWRRCQHEPVNDTSDARGVRVIPGIRFGVVLGESRDARHRLLRIAVEEQMPSVRERDEDLGLPQPVGQAVALELQISNDLRPEHPEDLGRPRDPEPRDDLIRDACATHALAPLEHGDRDTALRQVGRGDQPIVSSADDNRLVPRSHVSVLRRPGIRRAGRHTPRGEPAPGPRRIRVPPLSAPPRGPTSSRTPGWPCCTSP